MENPHFCPTCIGSFGTISVLDCGQLRNALTVELLKPAGDSQFLTLLFQVPHKNAWWSVIGLHRWPSQRNYPWCSRNRPAAQVWYHYTQWLQTNVACQCTSDESAEADEERKQPTAEVTDVLQEIKILNEAKKAPQLHVLLGKSCHDGLEVLLRTAMYHQLYNDLLVVRHC